MCFLWAMKSILMQTYFTVPAQQDGRCVNPLLAMQGNKTWMTCEVVVGGQIKTTLLVNTFMHFTACSS
jgi:hypothetical protein